MAFTEDEIDAVIEQYLNSEVAVSRTKTGSRNTTAIKRQVYDLLSTGIFLRPSSIFYLLWLSTNRLRNRAATQLSLLQDIEDAAPNVSRVSKRVESTAELSNAEAAIIELSGSFNQRTSGVSGAVGPATQRFRSAITAFATTELTKNVVSQGEVIETAEELREKVQTLWLAGAAADLDLRDRVDALQGGLEEYRSIRLPETVFQSLVAKIQTRLSDLQTAMKASTAPRDSRNALLEILAMRTLLQRASNFRAPSSTLAPLVSDTTTGLLTNSDGVEASVTGTVSGPFNYASGLSLLVDLNSSTELLTTALPGSSAAVLRSKTMSPWAAPGSVNAASFLVNGSSTNTVAMAAWASGAAAAAALDAAYADIVVTWDASASQLVFTTVSTADSASLLVTGHADFIDWAFPGIPLSATSTPVDITDVVEAISLDSNSVEAAEDFTSYYSGPASVSGTTLTIHLHEGTDLDATGTAIVTVDSNLEALGIVPGNIIKITSPAVTRAILAVDGNTLTLDSAVSAASNATYFIAPDLSDVPVGARVKLVSTTSPANTTWARVTFVDVGNLNLDRLLGTDAVQAAVFTSHLVLTTRGTTTNSTLSAASTTANNALGIATGSIRRASLTKFTVSGLDFVSRGVSVGDTVALVSPGATSYSRTVTEVGVGYLMLSPAVPYEVGSWTYEVSSAPYVTFELLVEELDAFETSLPSTAEIEAVMRRIVAGARYSSQLEQTLTAYIEALEDLIAALDAYAVPREPTMDRAVSLLREHGMDRALDLLLDLDLTTFFSMKDDEVSYRTWLIRKSADVTREVAPVTKEPRDNAAQWRTISSQSTTFDPRAARDKESNG
jgi:hypothetical protein